MPLAALLQLPDVADRLPVQLHNDVARLERAGGRARGGDDSVTTTPWTPWLQPS
jgi:hypothetical protein